MTERVDPHFLVVGHLNKVHGTKGEVYVWPLTDHPESLFAPGVVLSLGDKHGAVRGDGSTLVIESVRAYRRGYLVRFEGAPTRNHAEALVGQYVLKSVDELEGRDEDELFYHELLGLRVVLTDGTEVGSVREVYPLRPADLLEVVGPKGKTMIPFLKDVVASVDLDARVMTIDPPEGLLDL